STLPRSSSISSASAPSRANRNRTWPSRIRRRNFCWTRVSRSGSSSTTRIVEVIPFPSRLHKIERLEDDILVAETDLLFPTSRHYSTAEHVEEIDDTRRRWRQEGWID